MAGKLAMNLEAGGPAVVLRVESPERRVWQSWSPVLQLGPALLLLGLFLALPLLVMFGMTFFRSGVFGVQLQPTLANYANLFTDTIYLTLLLKSLRMSLTVTAIVMLVSYPAAYWLAKVVRQRKYLWLLLVFIPYWVNYVVRTYAWIPLLGRNGLLNELALRTGLISEPFTFLLYSEFAVHLVMVYVFLPFGMIPLYLSLERIDRDLLRASADLGASPAATFLHVVLPLSAPGLVGGGLTVFVLSVGAYVTPKLVGGPSGIMFGNVIADQFGATFNWALGATLAVALAVVTLGIVFLLSRRIPVARVFLET